MRELWRLVTGLAFVGGVQAAMLTSTQAFAQSAPNWTGGYLGMSIGYAWGSTEYSSIATCSTPTSTGCLYGGATALQQENLTALGRAGSGKIDSGKLEADLVRAGLNYRF